VQRRSCGSVRIAFLDRNRAVAELVACAQRLLARDDRVIAVMISHQSGFLHTVLRELVPLGGDDRIWSALKRKAKSIPRPTIAPGA